MDKLIAGIISAKFSEGLKCDHCTSSELLGISVPTAFSWRHKLLGAISGTENNKFSGLVEIGEIYLPENQKGNKNIETRPSRDHSDYRLNGSIRDGAIPVIVAKDSFNNVLSEVCDNGRLDRFNINEKLGNLLASTNAICTGNFAAYSSFAKNKKIKHYRSLNLAMQDNKIFNIDNVRKYIKELKLWMKKFRGVASKYLSLYLSWFKLLNSGAFDKTAGTGTWLLAAV